MTWLCTFPAVLDPVPLWLSMAGGDPWLLGGDGGDASGPLHDKPDLHVGHTVLLGLSTALVRRGEVEIEAQ